MIVPIAYVEFDGAPTNHTLIEYPIHPFKCVLCKCHMPSFGNIGPQTKTLKLII